VEITVCVTDDDYEAWRRVRIEVVPHERASTVAQMRSQDSPERLMVLATENGEVIGSGLAGRSDSGGAFLAPRVRPAYRRQGVGSALLGHLAAYLVELGFPQVRGMVDDDESLAFAEHFGFVEIDRQVEQVLAVTDPPRPSAPPAGVRVVDLAERPELWLASYDTFGTEVLADFALYEPLQVSAEQWASPAWIGEPMFLALADGEVIGCAGLHVDTDRPGRAENALTAVRRSWRGTGVASYLKRLTIRWAAEHDITEIYTWTQAGNESMIRLNQHLGYAAGQTSITLSRPLPLD
jgi:GNAT superfamily N-acetyltransferase